jgi:cyclic-di-GMP-binding biofilm dispersal mediator protein
LSAGLVAFGPIGATPFHVVERLTRVNATAQIQVVSALLNKLQESASQGRQPFVLSISGVISERPMAGLSAYSASKSAIRGYAQAASKELRKFGITWLDARPGHTESGLANRSIFGESPNLGSGMTVAHVVARMIKALSNDEVDVPSEAFAELDK